MLSIARNLAGLSVSSNSLFCGNFGAIYLAVDSLGRGSASRRLLSTMESDIRVSLFVVARSGSRFSAHGEVTRTRLPESYYRIAVEIDFNFPG